MRLGLICTVSFLVVALAGTLALAEPEGKAVSFKVRVCETAGDSPRPLLHEKAAKAWEACDKPVIKVPVFLTSGSDKSGLIETDQDGIASVGPVSVAKGGKVRLMLACTTHNCLNFTFDEPGVREGENLLVYLTKRLPPPKETNEGEKDQGSATGSSD